MADPGIGLALSGGGYRATLFNLGGLWRLNELGMLREIKRITSVSGGSITSGVLALGWKRLVFDDGIATNFREVVVAPLQAFCKEAVDISAGLGGLLSLDESAADKVAGKYREKLFGDATLQDLPADDEGPRFVFYATSLQTGASVRLSRPYVADYHLGQVPNPRVPLARAVAASSAFPPALSPVAITFPADAWEKTAGADLYEKRTLRETMMLTDGGVYDNLGLENVWERYEVVLASDAGKPFGVEEDPSALWHKQLARVLDIMSEQAHALRTRNLIAAFKRGERKGAYWGISTRIDDYGLADALVRDNPATGAVQAIRTRLNPFTDEEQGRIINWGYALCDAAVRKLLGRTGKARAWPMPGFAL